MDQATGTVFNIQRYSLHDGPGIRTTVFLKGCPLSCAWCHNPESISAGRELIVAENRCIDCGACRDACSFGASIPGMGVLPARNAECDHCGSCVDACPTGARQMVGERMTVAHVLADVLKDRIFHEESGGGVTISGGEPLLQMRFLRVLLPALRAEGVHVAIDTSGFGPVEPLLEAARLADLVLYDLKAFDDQRHRMLTGVSNWSILANLRALDAVHRNIWIRVPIVPGFTDGAAELERMATLVAGLRHVTRVNLLPYHAAAERKYERLGRVNAASAVQVPTADQMEQAALRFAGVACPVQVGG
jgi:pyruvate formate lyase activating enzyme